MFYIESLFELFECICTIRYSFEILNCRKKVNPYPIYFCHPVLHFDSGDLISKTKYTTLNSLVGYMYNLQCHIIQHYFSRYIPIFLT